MKEYKRLTSGELNDFISRVVVQLEPTLTQQVISLVLELEEYRTKIENGTLVERPPVKKGNRIWLVRKYWDYFEGRTKKEVVGRIVKRIFLNDDNSLTFSCLAIHKGTKLISIVKSTTFNKTWFFTKAEVEQKLKELQNERD